jgi:hypothetical protein
MLRRSRILRNVGLSVAAVACAVSFLLHGDLRLMLFIGMGGMGVFLALLGLDGSVREVRASIDAAGIRVGEKVVAARHTIRAGWIERSYAGTRVHLDRGVYPDIELEAADDAEAGTLLRAVACDPSQTVVRFPSVYRFVTLAVSAGMAGQLCARELVGRDGRHASTPQFLLLFVTCCFWPLVAYGFRPREMSVGADGVLVSGFLRNRFVLYAEIESAVVESVGKLVLWTRTHDRLVSRMSGPAAEAAAELIESAITSPHSGSEAVRLQLRREGESEGDAGAWLARLRSLASLEPYRAVAFGRDALWRVVDDPGATGAERAAAAVVLGAAATPAERARLRDAAARMASPRVRVAIERVAAGAGAAGDHGDDELAMAMEALAADSAA